MKNYFQTIYKFEKGKTKSQKIALCSIFIAIGVVGRCIFFMIPQVQPMTAVIIICGICFGSRLGGIAGCLSILISNIFLGQGIWTISQMILFGSVGFLAGLIFKFISHKTSYICIYGALSALLYGLFMNIFSFVLFFENASISAFFIYILPSLPMDILHSVSTVIFLFFLEKPIEVEVNKLLNPDKL